MLSAFFSVELLIFKKIQFHHIKFVNFGEFEASVIKGNTLKKIAEILLWIRPRHQIDNIDNNYRQLFLLYWYFSRYSSFFYDGYVKYTKIDQFQKVKSNFLKNEQSHRKMLKVNFNYFLRSTTFQFCIFAFSCKYASGTKKFHSKGPGT